MVAQLGEELHAAQPDVWVVLSPHGPALTGSVGIAVDEKLQGSLVDFGDIQDRLELPGSPKLAHSLRQRAEDQAAAVNLYTPASLDYGVVVPVMLLQGPTPAAVLPIDLGGLQESTAIHFGRVLGDWATERHERIAVLASADWSRREQPEHPNQERPTPEERLVSEAISAVDPARMVQPQPSDTCGHLPVLTLLAAMQTLNAHGVIRSFEAPYGVGLLTAAIMPH